MCQWVCVSTGACVCVLCPCFGVCVCLHVCTCVCAAPVCVLHPSSVCWGVARAAVWRDPRRARTRQPEWGLRACLHPGGAVGSDSSFRVRNTQQKRRDINKAKRHPCLPAHRHRPLVCPEVRSESFGKHNGLRATALSPPRASPSPCGIPVSFTGRRWGPQEDLERLPLRPHSAQHRALEDSPAWPAQGCRFPWGLREQHPRLVPTGPGSQPGRAGGTGWGFALTYGICPCPSKQDKWFPFWHLASGPGHTTVLSRRQITRTALHATFPRAHGWLPLSRRGRRREGKHGPATKGK